MLVHAYLESVQPDGFAVLRLGQSPDAPALTVETEGEPPPPGQLVLFRIGDLSLWDQRL